MWSSCQCVFTTWLTGLSVIFRSAAIVARADAGLTFVSTTSTSRSPTMKTLLQSNQKPGGSRRTAAYTPGTTSCTSNPGPAGAARADSAVPRHRDDATATSRTGARMADSPPGRDGGPRWRSASAGAGDGQQTAQPAHLGRVERLRRL